MKIARIAENHFFPPEAAAPEQIVSFLNHFSIYQSEEQRVWREYQACLYAAGRDDSVAAALYLQNGPILRKKYMEAKCTEIACVSITPQPDGILLHFEPQFDLSFKLKAAYEKIRTSYENALIHLRSPNDVTPAMEKEILVQAYQVFFKMNRSFLSLPRELSASALANLSSYLTALRKASDLDSVEQKEIAFDADWLQVPGMTHDGADVFLSYDSFTASLTSADQRAQNFKMRYDRTLDTLAEHYAAHPEWNSTTIYSSAEVRSWFSKNTFEAATDPLKNFITKVSRGKYQLTFIDLLNAPPEESELDNDDGDLVF